MSDPVVMMAMGCLTVITVTAIVVYGYFYINRDDNERYASKGHYAPEKEP